METLSRFSLPALEILESLPTPVAIQPTPTEKVTKNVIRASLKASTLDGVFATLFSSVTSGVLLTNFLLQLKANPVEIGMLSSIPMLVNLLQPLGAYIGDRTNSRHFYCLWIFGPARLLWLILAMGVFWFSSSGTNSHYLVIATLTIIFTTNFLGALGSSAWFSWMAALVPHRLRGRYFGLRNSAASLTNLLCIPLLGFAISAWPRGTVEGYGVMLLLAVVAGIISLAFQCFMVDVNPQDPQSAVYKHQPQENTYNQLQKVGIFKNNNFLKFLLYFGTWTFAVNLSSPFFNLYLLDNLNLDLGKATLYTSIAAAANLIMLILWGKLADRWGNRPLLLLVGVLVALTPLFWLTAGTDSLSIWVSLPLIHLLTGGTVAAIDLCNSNIQMEVAPAEQTSKYFAIAAAVAGVCGGLGTTAGGFLAELHSSGGLPGLFIISAGVRLIALLPLVFVQEPRSQSVVHLVKNLLPFKRQMALIPAVEVIEPTK